MPSPTEEQLAAEVVADALGAVAVRKLDVVGAPPGTVDFAVDLAGGTVEPLEVTSFRHEEWLSLNASIDALTWDVPALTRSWNIVLRGRPPLRALQNAVEGLLLRVEQGGLEQFADTDEDVLRALGDPAAASDGHRAVVELMSLGVVAASSSSQPSGHLSIGRGFGGVRHAGLVNAAVERCLQANAAKLARAAPAGVRRHLFVWLDSASQLAWLCLREPPPASSPAMPADTEVWVAGYEDFLWRAASSGGWVVDTAVPVISRALRDRGS